MPSVILLGTGAAVTDPHRTTTMLAVTGSEGIIAVDCGGDLVHRLLAAGIDPVDLGALILTHEHADHTSGFPLFMEKIWLHGRRDPVPVFGPPSAISQVQRLFETYDTTRWKGLPEILWSPFTLENQTPVFRNWGFDVTASPGDHGVPVVGLRFECIETGSVAIYSADTQPTENIANLSRGAHLLIHEATGSMKGHTSADQAAQLAAQAGVVSLVLVHLSPSETYNLTSARRIFPATEFGIEMGVYPF